MIRNKLSGYLMKLSVQTTAIPFWIAGVALAIDPLLPSRQVLEDEIEDMEREARMSQQ